MRSRALAGEVWHKEITARSVIWLTARQSCYPNAVASGGDCVKADARTNGLASFLLRRARAVARSSPRLAHILRPLLGEVLRKLRHTSNQTIRDLDAIANLIIPRNAEFQARKQIAENIEGMFSPFSMAIFDTLLCFQNANSIVGNVLEIGTYRGRTAVLLRQLLKPQDEVILVDIEDNLDRAGMARIPGTFGFLRMASSAFKKSQQFKAGKRRYRFVHIDASHGFHETYEELTMADRLLTSAGLIALDDFGNFNYSQNAAAIFRYLYTADTDLQVLLVTDEKLYLCRRQALAIYAPFILDRFIAEMRSRDVGDFMLARTENDMAEYCAFYGRSRQPGETGHFYGKEIYRELYEHQF